MPAVTRPRHEGHAIPHPRLARHHGRPGPDRPAGPRLLELTLSESRGEEADEVNIRLHDHDGRLALPCRGVALQMAIGWRSGGLFDKGSFLVDDVEHSGPPDIITIRARSADLTGAIRGRRERSWHDTTLGEVLGTIAGEHSLRPAIAAELAGMAIAHLDQANESDINRLTRLRKRFDAVATVKAGTLIFAPIGAGQTASGQPLPGVSITRADGGQHRGRPRELHRCASLLGRPQHGPAHRRTGGQGG